MKYQIGLDYTLPEGLMRPYFEALREGHVLAANCRDCGFTSYPPRFVCVSCRSHSFAWLPLSGRASVVVQSDTVSTSFALVCFDGSDGLTTVAVENPSVNSLRCRLIAAEPEYAGLLVRLKRMES